MNRLLVSVVALAGVLAFASSLPAQEPILIEIQVAPSTVSLDSQGEVVTVHTDIAYGAVAGASVMLDGLEIAWWKSDNQGNFVAKFNLDDVKDMLRDRVGQQVEVTLTGITKGGVDFYGTDMIRVVKPRK